MLKNQKTVSPPHCSITESKDCISSPHCSVNWAHSARFFGPNGVSGR